MIRLGLRLDPLGPLLFRDGRPLDPGSRGYGGLPTPRTLAGALHTAILSGCPGFDLDRFRAESRMQPLHDALILAGAPDWLRSLRIRGPWLALTTNDHGSVTPLLPTPAVLVCHVDDKGNAKHWARNRPWNNLPGWRESPLLPLWRDSLPDAAYPGGYLTLDGIQTFLNGGCPEDSHFYRSEQLYSFDDRTHVAINAETQTALDGMLYGTRRLVLRTEIGVSFYAEIIVNEHPDESQTHDWLRDLFQNQAIPFGGKSGSAVSYSLKAPVDWPTVPADPSAHGSVWLLATPAFASSDNSGRAYPDGLPRDIVRAAASREPITVASWDTVHNGPRPTRYAVPAGSVYFASHDNPYSPQHDSLCNDPDDIAHGWGYALRGVWNPS